MPDYFYLLYLLRLEVIFMHVGHHGILDEINEEHKHVHSKKTQSNTLNLWKIVGVIALSVVLILLFRIIFNK